MLVKWIRVGADLNVGRGTPIGCIVAVGRDKIGFSFCNPKDRFDKKLGRELAAGRAVLGTSTNVPTRFFDLDNNYKTLYLEDELQHEIEVMRRRAERYFH